MKSLFRFIFAWVCFLPVILCVFTEWLLDDDPDVWTAWVSWATFDIY